jgi:hypothetical protein
VSHTPAPWILDPQDVIDTQDPGFFGQPGDPEGYHMVSTENWRVTGFIGDANAKLIAAAPELLAALQGLFAGQFIESGATDGSEWGNELAQRLVVCRAAIAKATGTNAV